MAQMIKEYDQLVKLILIGSSGVGKSSLLLQFAQNKFTEQYMTTIGVDFRFKTLKIDNKTIKFQVWDTAGQDRFRTITSSYYKGADGIIIVYDITDNNSFEDIGKYWIPEAENYAQKGIDMLILGNKSDCDREVSLEKVKKFVDSRGHDFEEVSAKNGDKVFEAIRNFGKKIAQKKMKKSMPASSSSTAATTSNAAGQAKGGVSLNNSSNAPNTGKKNSSCC